MKYQKLKFLISINSITQLKKYNDGKDIIFLGRSNVGKSTIINIISNNKKMVKISNNPGSTKLINIFTFNNNDKLIDFPGYGYSKYLKKNNNHWFMFFKKYLFYTKKNLKGVILIIDSRHLFNNLDHNVIKEFIKYTKNIHIIFNKIDKLNIREKQSLNNNILKYLNKLQHEVTYQFFSSIYNIGLQKLYNQLDIFFE